MIYIKGLWLTVHSSDRFAFTTVCILNFTNGLHMTERIGI